MQALAFFTSANQPEAGLVVWRRLISLGQPFALSGIFPFIDTLIVDNLSDDARTVWHDAVASAKLPAPVSSNASSVWDGDFSSDFANGGLGCRWNAPVGVAIGFDDPPPDKGGRSVRLDFSGGSNLTLETPSQFVIVEPNRTYLFHALMRTGQVTTESGVRFSITDPNHSGAVNLATDNFTGSHSWTALDLNVTTGLDTHFLLLRLIRNPSRLFENKISGTAWIADISLVPVKPAGSQSQ